MLRRAVRLFPAVAAAAVWLTAEAGVAQDPNAGRQGRPNRQGQGQRAPSDAYLGLLAMPEVQKELHFSDNDKATLPLLRDEMHESDKKFLDSVKGMPREESAGKSADRRKEIEKQITELLGPDRFKRFQEVRRQVNGLEASLRDSTVRDALQLTEEQNTKIREITRPAGGQGRNRTPPTDGATVDREAMRKERTEKVLAVLTDVQKAKWAEMIGAPITFTPPARGGRNRRPGQDNAKKPTPPEKAAAPTT